MIDMIELTCTFAEVDSLVVSDFSDRVRVPSIFLTIVQGDDDGREAAVEMQQPQVERLSRFLNEWIEERK